MLTEYSLEKKGSRNLVVKENGKAVTGGIVAIDGDESQALQAIWALEGKPAGIRYIHVRENEYGLKAGIYKAEVLKNPLKRKHGTGKYYASGFYFDEEHEIVGIG